MHVTMIIMAQPHGICLNTPMKGIVITYKKVPRTALPCIVNIFHIHCSPRQHADVRPENLNKTRTPSPIQGISTLYVDPDKSDDR